MGLSISTETVAKLRHTADLLKTDNVRIVEENQRLQYCYWQNRLQLGPHTFRVEELLTNNKKLQKEVEAEVERMTQRILYLADQMETFIQQNGESSNTYGTVAAGVKKEDKILLGLEKTQQTYQTVWLDDRECKVFDHPKQVAARGAYHQGTNSIGINETCGLCASATVMNIAGYRYSEDDVVLYAIEHGFCTATGRTTARNRNHIIEGMGNIHMSAHSMQRLEKVARLVEEGHGVIIGVDASLLNEKWYGPYDPAEPKGHAITLASVIRDAHTNEIVKYVIIDSNGPTHEKAYQEIDPMTLKRAFYALGACVNVTDEILY